MPAAVVVVVVVIIIVVIIVPWASGVNLEASVGAASFPPVAADDFVFLRCTPNVRLGGMKFRRIATSWRGL